MQKPEIRWYSAQLQVSEIPSIWVELSGAPARKEVDDYPPGAPAMIIHKHRDLTAKLNGAHCLEWKEINISWAWTMC